MSFYLRSRNFDFDQIDHLKSYINLNVVYPLNHNIPIPFKLNHQRELEKVVSGNLRRTEFSFFGRYQMKLMRLYDKIIRVINEPKLLTIYLNKKINKFNHASN